MAKKGGNMLVIEVPPGGPDDQTQQITVRVNNVVV